VIASRRRPAIACPCQPIQRIVTERLIVNEAASTAGRKRRGELENIACIVIRARRSAMISKQKEREEQRNGVFSAPRTRSNFFSSILQNRAKPIYKLLSRSSSFFASEGFVFSISAFCSMISFLPCI
jgi:hypothetical protein